MKKSLFLSLIRILVAVYILITFAIYLFQEKLLFFPATIDQKTISNIRKFYPDTTEFIVKSKDGKELHNWVIDNSKNEEPPYGTIFYFGGNAEEVSHWIEKLQDLKGWIIVLTNYRGYGLSEGTPGQKMLFDDALEIFDYFNSNEKYSGIKKISMGWSLGTGVAVHLAHKRKIDGVFLISPYDSITNIAKQNYPVFPISLMIRHPFDSAAIAHEITAPARIIAASNDRVIPPENSMKLASVWGGEKDILIVENYDHNSLISSAGFKKYFSESFRFFGEVQQQN
jgi:uncharacterized protein